MALTPDSEHTPPDGGLSDRERSRLLFEDAPLGICLVTREGRYLEVNPALARMYGYGSAEEMTSQRRNSRSAYADPVDRERLEELLEHMDVVTGFESLMARNGGGTLWTSRTVRRAPSPDGGEERWIMFVEDITARKESELASRAARRDLIAILEQLEAGIYVLEPGTRRIIYANSYLNQAMDRDLVGQVSNEVLLDPDGPCFVACAAETLTDPGDTLSRELLFANERWYLCTAKLSTWFGRERTMVVVATDITEKKEAEAAKEEIDRILRHDLKSPLTGIINVPEILLAGEDVREEDRELLEALRDSGKKMLNLIDSSLSLYKLELGRYELMLGRVDLVACVRDAARELETLTRLRKVEVNLGFPDRALSPTDSLIASLDRTLVPFLVSNLLKNAIEAAPKGSTVSVTLSGGREPTLVLHNLGAVPEPIRKTFFDKYVTHGKKQGTGLGTYSARLIARAHDGDVTMATSEQEGTTITVTLKAQTQEGAIDG